MTQQEPMPQREESVIYLQPRSAWTVLLRVLQFLRLRRPVTFDSWAKAHARAKQLWEKGLSVRMLVRGGRVSVPPGRWDLKDITIAADGGLLDIKGGLTEFHMPGPVEVEHPAEQEPACSACLCESCAEEDEEDEDEDEDEDQAELDDSEMLVYAAAFAAECARIGTVISAYSAKSFAWRAVMVLRDDQWALSEEEAKPERFYREIHSMYIEFRTNG
jgi:hypothetical protein